jgi:hypothetical protein
MRLVPQRIQKKNVQPFELTKRCLGNFAVIGKIRCASKAESVNLRLAMNQRTGSKRAPKNSTGPSIGRNSSSGKLPYL